MDPTEAAPTIASLLDAWELFSDAILCGAIAGAALGFLSVYIVLRRMVFVSAAVTQTAGLGVALAFFAEIHWGVAVPPLVGGTSLALLTTLLLAPEPRRLRLPRETILGLVYALAGALAIIIGDRISQEAHDIQSILFGSAVLVTPGDLRSVAITGGVLVALHVWFRRGVAFAAFDGEAARVQGLPVALLGGFLYVSVGLMVGVSARALGSLPVFAFSVLPAAAALLLGARLPWAFVWATALGAAAGAGGYVLAYFWLLPVGASQTAVAAAMALAALAIRMARRALRRAT